MSSLHESTFRTILEPRPTRPTPVNNLHLRLDPPLFVGLHPCLSSQTPTIGQRPVHTPGVGSRLSDQEVYGHNP